MNKFNTIYCYVLKIFIFSLLWIKLTSVINTSCLFSFRNLFVILLSQSGLCTLTMCFLRHKTSERQYYTLLHCSESNPSTDVKLQRARNDSFLIFKIIVIFKNTHNRSQFYILMSFVSCAVCIYTYFYEPF